MYRSLFIISVESHFELTNLLHASISLNTKAFMMLLKSVEALPTCHDFDLRFSICDLVPHLDQLP